MAHRRLEACIRAPSPSARPRTSLGCCQAALGAPLLASRLAGPGRLRLAALALAWGALLAAVTATGSRLGLLALVTGVAYWGLASVRSGALARPRRIRWVVLLAGLLLGVAAGFGERWSDPGSAIARVVHLRAALERVKVAPVAGHGLEHAALALPEGLRALRPALGPGWEPWIPKELLARTPNALLETAVEAGLPAAALLAALWFLALRRSGRDAALGPALGGVLVAAAVLGLGAAPLHHPALALVFWVAVGLVAAPPNVGPAPLSSFSRTARVPAVVAAFLVAAAVLGHQARALATNRLAAQGHAALAQGRHAEAEHLARRVLVRAPAHHEAAVVLGLLLLHQERPQEALEVLGRAEQHGVSLDAWLLKADALRAVGSGAQARVVLEAALAAVPDFVRARLLLGDLHDEAGDEDLPVQAYRAVLASPQTSARARVWKERAQARLAVLP
jgi:hypothetical protein